jgi:hypothetical protein
LSYFVNDGAWCASKTGPVPPRLRRLPSQVQAFSRSGRPRGAVGGLSTAVRYLGIEVNDALEMAE